MFQIHKISQPQKSSNYSIPKPLGFLEEQQNPITLRSARICSSSIFSKPKRWLTKEASLLPPGPSRRLACQSVAPPDTPAKRRRSHGRHQGGRRGGHRLRSQPFQSRGDGHIRRVWCELRDRGGVGEVRGEAAAGEAPDGEHRAGASHGRDPCRLHQEGAHPGSGSAPAGAGHR